MAQDKQSITDAELVGEAMRRAARVATHGTREERAGRFIETEGSNARLYRPKPRVPGERTGSDTPPPNVRKTELRQTKGD